MTSTSLKAKLESVKTEFEKSVNQFEASAGADATKIEQRYRTFQQIRQQVADTIVRPRLEAVSYTHLTLPTILRV